MYVQGWVARNPENPQEPQVVLADDLSDKVFHHFYEQPVSSQDRLPIGIFFPSKSNEEVSVSGGDLAEVLTTVGKLDEGRFWSVRKGMGCSREESERERGRIQGWLTGVFGEVSLADMNRGELLRMMGRYSRQLEEWKRLGDINIRGRRIELGLGVPSMIPTTRLIQVSQASMCGPEGCKVGERKDPDASLYAPFCGVAYHFSLQFASA